jgi:hypothetical protein
MGNIFTGSYGQELADKWGRRSRAIVSSPGYQRIFGFGLSSESAAANRWSNTEGGEYLAVGVGGPVTGKAIRAQAIRGRMALHGLYIPINAPWAAEFKRELLTFPAGKHDDQVDAIGLIGQLLDHVWRGSKPKEPEKRRWEYEGKGPVMPGNASIRELFRRKERARREWE